MPGPGHLLSTQGSSEGRSAYRAPCRALSETDRSAQQSCLSMGVPPRKPFLVPNSMQPDQRQHLPHRSPRFLVRRDLGPRQIPPLVSSVALRKSLNLSEPFFLICKLDDKYHGTQTGLLFTMYDRMSNTYY